MHGACLDTYIYGVAENNTFTQLGSTELVGTRPVGHLCE